MTSLLIKDIYIPPNHSYIDGKAVDEWFSPNIRKCGFPIMLKPAISSSDILGTAFFLRYDQTVFIVTVKHNTDLEKISEERNITITPDDFYLIFITKDRKIIRLPYSKILEMGNQWVFHTDESIDIAVMPLILPLKILKHLDIVIIEPEWISEQTSRKGDNVAILGYPFQETVNYDDSSASPYPHRMPGIFQTLDNEKVSVLETAAVEGVSGGPVFRRNKSSAIPSLIGITIQVEKNKTYRTNEQFDLERHITYTNQTKIHNITFLLEILQSENIRNLMDQIKIPQGWNEFI